MCSTPPGFAAASAAISWASRPSGTPPTLRRPEAGNSKGSFFTIGEVEEPLSDRVLEPDRQRHAPDEPVVYIGVLLRQQQGELLQFRHSETRQLGFGEAAQDQVELLHPAVPALKQEAPPQRGFLLGNLVSGHRFRYTLPTRINHRESPLRPQILFPLFAAVTSLPGIGPRFGKLLEKLCGPNVVSLLWHLPTGIVDRSAEPDLEEVVEGTIITAVVKPLAHMPPNNPRQPYRVSCVN